MADLIIDDLTVEYDAGGYAVRPLDGFCATVSDGSLAVLLGPSGCGKTTLLSCLGGILTPDQRDRSGTATSRSPACSGAALTTYRQRDVGIVFQSFNLVPSLSATRQRDGAAAGRRRRRHAGPPASRRTARTRRSRRTARGTARREMSGGQQQRVSLARALAHDPPIIIADEPTASLDYVQVEGVLRLLRDLAAPGRVVVVATHDDRLLPLADQIIEMVPRFHEDASAPTTTELATGEVLFAQGSRGNRIFVIESGSIEIVREHTDGTTELLATLQANQHFGEMGPLFGLPRSATARAGSATERGRLHTRAVPQAHRCRATDRSDSTRRQALSSNL